jgi:hypothetical protein
LVRVINLNKSGYILKKNENKWVVKFANNTSSLHPDNELELIN